MYRFDDLISVADRPTLIGSKAENLIRLREGGFNVPGGFVVTTAELGGLSGTAPLNTFTTETLGAYIDENTAYAVRSSGVGEDLADLSFAGQYDSYLNVKGTASVYEATLKCAQSIHNDRLAAYAQSRGINDISQYPMAVIIQTMVDSDKSGVAFSIDSVNGKDKEILIEAVRGLGDQLVSGQVTPDSYGYHWYDDILTSYQGGVLTEAEVKAVAAVVLDIQVFYGFPVDVEWAIADGSIFILQSRPITTISTRAIPQEWTTADFRDGGVSAAACKPLMASLYGLVFNASFLDSLKTIKLLPTAYQESIYEVFFARPYWRLTLEKECFARLPGFVEREIDEDMGVVPTYTGDGVVTPTTPRTLWRGLLTLRAISRHIKIMGDKAAVRRQELLQRLTTIGSLDLTGRSATDLHKLWIRFVRDDYYTSEYTYFGYIFCNMILSTLFKDKIKKHLPAGEITNLMIGLTDLSHMRPICRMWDISRRIHIDETLEEDHGSKTVGSGTNSSKAHDKELAYPGEAFADFLSDYGYHSQHELDVSYPNWDEQPQVVLAMIHDFAALPDDRDPKALTERQHQKYLAAKSRVPRHLHKDISQLRDFLWWREEFRDISTRSYYHIRRLSLALGQAWAAAGVLEEADDIFYLTVDDITALPDVTNKFPSGASPDVKTKLTKNKQYYASFINFSNPNEIGNKHTTAAMSKARMTSAGETPILHGVPCSGETVTATARVIQDIHDAHRLEPGNILVTKCTDPAWTAVFSKISGVITETGGMLSHAAVVSREYGLPCILVVHNATEVIRDGDVITMDCRTGDVFISAQINHTCRITRAMEK